MRVLHQPKMTSTFPSQQKNDGEHLSGFKNSALIHKRRIENFDASVKKKLFFKNSRKMLVLRFDLCK